VWFWQLVLLTTGVVLAASPLLRLRWELEKTQ
jgi:hypothetical protein